MNEPLHLDLFSGIGGFSLAFEAAGFRTIGFCEFEPDRQRDLRHHWPRVPIVPDINDIDAICRVVSDSAKDGRELAEHHDRECRKPHSQDWGSWKSGGVNRPALILTAGVPCQPASAAGKRKGSADDRWLWPQTLRVVDRLRPDWGVFENPLGIASLAQPAAVPGVDIERLRDVPGRTICEILTAIRLLGYEFPTDRDGVPWIPVVPAAGVGAFHGRDRLWIIARRGDVEHSESAGLEERIKQQPAMEGSEGRRVAGAAVAATGTNAQRTVGNAEREQFNGCGSTWGRRGQSANANSITCERSNESSIGSVSESIRAAVAATTGERASTSNSARCIELPNWSDAILEQGQDGKWRAVKPGLRLLANGIPRRTSKLRGFGNAICPQVAYQIAKTIREKIMPK